jgi:hypothetical protein
MVHRNPPRLAGAPHVIAKDVPGIGSLSAIDTLSRTAHLPMLSRTLLLPLPMSQLHLPMLLVSVLLI